MNCIQFNSPSPLFLANPIHNQQLKTSKLLLSHNQEHTRPVMSSQTRTRAIANPLVLGAASRVIGGNISVLIPISTVLLIAYGIANFLVPALLTKYYYGSEETSDDQSKDNDED